MEQSQPQVKSGETAALKGPLVVGVGPRMGKEGYVGKVDEIQLILVKE